MQEPKLQPQPTDLTAVRLYAEMVRPDGIFVGRCVEFPALECFAPTRVEALSAVAGVASGKLKEATHAE